MEQKDFEKSEKKRDKTGLRKPEKDPTKENPYLKVKQNATDKAKSSFDYAVMTSKNIDKNIRSNIEKAKESQTYQEFQEKMTLLENEIKIKRRELKKNTPRILSRIKEVILSIFEQIVGRIRIGTQYGKSSIDLLSDLAKLKELGIISEEEFNQKKKEILERI